MQDVPAGQVPSPGISQGAGGGQTRSHVVVPSALHRHPYWVVPSGQVPSAHQEPTGHEVRPSSRQLGPASLPGALASDTYGEPPSALQDSVKQYASPPE